MDKELNSRFATYTDTVPPSPIESVVSMQKSQPVTKLNKVKIQKTNAQMIVIVGAIVCIAVYFYQKKPKEKKGEVHEKTAIPANDDPLFTPFSDRSNNEKKNKI